jgi:hypothetical protein
MMAKIAKTERHLICVEFIFYRDVVKELLIMLTYYRGIGNFHEV